MEGGISLDQAKDFQPTILDIPVANQYTMSNVPSATNTKGIQCYALDVFSRMDLSRFSYAPPTLVKLQQRFARVGNDRFNFQKTVQDGCVNWKDPKDHCKSGFQFKNLDACFVGLPLDTGTCNRPGARFGPREIRKESFFFGLFNVTTGAQPLKSLRVADIGDFYCNLYDLQKGCAEIKEHYLRIIESGCRPLTLGGDHTITYPILQAMKKKYGKVGLIHVDAHCDTLDEVFGMKITHGTPFRRAVDEELVDCKRVVQIGLRGWVLEPAEFNWGKEQGFRQVRAADCWYKSLAPLMQEVREQMGDSPVYLSFDIDGLDPAYAPGTDMKFVQLDGLLSVYDGLNRVIHNVVEYDVSLHALGGDEWVQVDGALGNVSKLGTPEAGGLTTIQGLEIIRGCRGLHIVGADLVEVSPQYDTSGNTARLGSELLFEMLSILPGVEYFNE